MLGIFFVKGRPRTVNTEDFNKLWKEILEFKKMNQPEADKSPDFIGLQDKLERRLLLAIYDKDRWVLETLVKDWDSPFGRIDLAGNFGMHEAILDDEELRTALKTLMTEGELRVPSKHTF